MGTAFEIPMVIFLEWLAKYQNSEVLVLVGHSPVISILQDGWPDHHTAGILLGGLESRLQESLGFPAIASAVACQPPVFII
jgi:hypothetical protein